MFPYEKYNFFTNNKNLVIAEQTYAGKKYRGKAVLGEGDKFDLESGKRLAAARCDAKICHKRFLASREKLEAVEEMISLLNNLKEDAGSYFEDASRELYEAAQRLSAIERELGLPETK